MRRIAIAFAALLALALPAAAQVNPANLPANTVVGRLGVTTGPAQAIPFQFLISNLFLSPIGSTVTINPPAASQVQGLNIGQTGPTTGSQTTSLNFNQIVVNSDQSAITVNGPTANALDIAYNFGGSNTQGGKFALLVSAALTAATSVSDTNKSYAAGAFLGTASANNGGTNTGGGAKGNMTGLNPFVNLQAAATNWASAVGEEIDVQMLSGSSVGVRQGLTVVGFGSGAGATEDEAIHIGSNVTTSSWNNAVFLSHQNGAAPLLTTGCVICTDTNADTIATGINLSTYTITGNFLQGPGGFSVTGAGALTAASVVGTSFVLSPLVVGGSASSSTAVIRSTSGTAGTDAIVFQTGTNGATEAARFVTSGVLKFGSPSFTANGAGAAVTFGATTPGAITTPATVFKWLTLQDNSGNTFYVPTWH